MSGLERNASIIVKLFDRLKRIRKANDVLGRCAIGKCQAPREHPDLDPFLRGYQQTLAVVMTRDATVIVSVRTIAGEHTDVNKMTDTQKSGPYCHGRVRVVSM
jgi:hypothetical protein